MICKRCTLKKWKLLCIVDINIYKPLFWTNIKPLSKSSLEFDQIVSTALQFSWLPWRWLLQNGLPEKQKSPNRILSTRISGQIMHIVTSKWHKIWIIFVETRSKWKWKLKIFQEKKLVDTLMSTFDRDKSLKATAQKKASQQKEVASFNRLNNRMAHSFRFNLSV